MTEDAPKLAKEGNASLEGLECTGVGGPVGEVKELL